MSSVKEHLKQGNPAKEGNPVREKYYTWGELPLKDKFDLWRQRQVDRISEIPYWLHIAEIALFSKHPHSKAIEEGLNPYDINTAKGKIGLAFGTAFLAIASGALLASR